MNVLLLNAGAKNDGATQEILLTIKHALHADSDIVCLGDLVIKYCKGCKVCYNTPKCIQDDDMYALINRIDASDILIIAAPSYWADVPGQFKVFIDRCTPYSNTNPNIGRRTLKGGKTCYAIALRTGTRPAECEHIIETIAHWCGHMGIDMAGSIYFCGINNKEDIEKHKDLICEKVKDWLSE